MKDIIEQTVRELWKGAKSTPEIIVELENRGIKVSEKRILDTARDLDLEGWDIYSRIYNNPGLIDNWWREFEVKEEESALKLLQMENIKNVRGIGRARYIAGCAIADELKENGATFQQILQALSKKGFEEKEIQKIRKDVGF